MAEAVAVAVLTFFAIEATPLAVAITTVIIGIGISVGTSLLAQAFLAPSAQQTAGPPPSDRQFISKAPVAPRFRCYGRVRVAGGQAFLAARKGTLYRVLAHNDGRIDGVEEHLIDETVVTVGADGWVTAPDKYQGRVRILWRDGANDQAYYAELKDAFADWDATHKGNGVAHSLTLFKQVGQEQFFDVYPSGENTLYKRTQRGVRVWDPRDPAQSASDASTWLWSDNAALCILDFLRHESGFGMPMAWLEPELAIWKAAADACDEPVTLKAGGTEKRYRLWGSYAYDERPADVLSRMLTACNGRLWIGPNGGLALSVGVWTEPTVVIGDDAIVSYKLGSGNEAPDTANTLTAVYTESAMGYVETEAEPWVDEASLLAYGEQRSDAKLYMVPSHSQCRRLMKQAFGRLAPAWKGTLTTNLAALAALTERYVTIMISELDLTITAEIDNVQFRVEQGNVVTGLVIDFTAITALAFAFDPATEEGTPSEVPAAIASSSISPPDNFNVLMDHRGGNVVGEASWTKPVIDTLKTVVEFRRDFLDAADWQVVKSTDGSSSVTTPTLVDGATYKFRARHVGLLRSSDWSPIITRDAVYDAVAPGAPTGLSTAKVATTVTIAWANPSSSNTYGARVYRHTANTPASATLVATRYGGASAALSYQDTNLAAGTYWWWVAAINGSGVESVRTAAGTETIP